MAKASRTQPARSSRIWLLLLAFVALALVVAIVLNTRSAPDSDAVTTSATATAPVEIPSGLVPAQAVDVTGQIATQRGRVVSAAVDFTVPGTDRDQLQADVEQASSGAGWNILERVYDDRQMRLLFLNEVDDTLTVTMTIEGDEILAAAVFVRSS
jgi:hypothetical protein